MIAQALLFLNPLQSKSSMSTLCYVELICMWHRFHGLQDNFNCIMTPLEDGFFWNCQFSVNFWAFHINQNTINSFAWFPFTKLKNFEPFSMHRDSHVLHLLTLVLQYLYLMYWKKVLVLWKLVSTHALHYTTVKPQFTGPLGGRN